MYKTVTSTFSSIKYYNMVVVWFGMTVIYLELLVRVSVVVEDKYFSK